MRIETAVVDNQTRITVGGDIDLYSSPELRAAVLHAVPESTDGVDIHLGDVTYMDSSGVATLVEGLRSAKEHGKAFVLLEPSTAVMKVLELARLDSVFDVKTA